MTKRIAVLVELHTDHPLLDPGRVDVSTVEATQALRQAVVDSLPDLKRVVAVLPVDLAQMMMEAHDEVSRELGHGIALRPPKAYRRPDR